MMPFDIQWHADLPVLVVTYQGKLTLKEYQKLIAQRAAMLNDGPAQVVILADMQDFESFPDAEQLTETENATAYDNVRSLVVVLPQDMYKRISHASTRDLDRDFALYFFGNRDQALEAAGALLG